MSSLQPGTLRGVPAEGLVEHLGRGEAVLFPTDTLPALACRPEAATLLWQLKARPADKPLILMGADLDQLRAVLDTEWEQAWLEQARCCWPGAVTLVLPIRGTLTEHLNPGGSSLGLRVPACERARRLLQASGPLATTSANRSGHPPALDAEQAATQFPALPVLAPLPWPAGSGRASTVMAWRHRPGAAPGGDWEILRSGEAPPPGEAVAG